MIEPVHIRMARTVGHKILLAGGSCWTSWGAQDIGARWWAVAAGVLATLLALMFDASHEASERERLIVAWKATPPTEAELANTRQLLDI